MLNSAILSMVVALTPADALCLQKNAYFEARNQSDAGMVAVTHVVLNRVKSDRFPDTVCEVVKQGVMSSWWREAHDKEVPVRHKCQFSWFCDGLSDEPKEKAAWKHAQRVALEAYALWHVGFDNSDGSLWYHAKNVSPNWRSDFRYVTQIDDHLFYAPK
jgi:spore germination cell wall hydrolase CwlJ-like protein